MYKKPPVSGRFVSIFIHFVSELVGICVDDMRWYVVRHLHALPRIWLNYISLFFGYLVMSCIIRWMKNVIRQTRHLLNTIQLSLFVRLLANSYLTPFCCCCWCWKLKIWWAAGNNAKHFNRKKWRRNENQHWFHVIWKGVANWTNLTIIQILSACFSDFAFVHVNWWRIRDVPVFPFNWQLIGNEKRTQTSKIPKVKRKTQTPEHTKSNWISFNFKFPNTCKRI